MHRVQGRSRKNLLVLSLVLNLGLLLYFKYANFFVDNVNFMLNNMGLSPMSWIKVALPIGISFYTFQTLTYSIDIYRRVQEPLDNVRDYLVYIMSFPQMIAGPIVRYSQIAQQLVARKENYHDKLLGLFRFIIGLSKKVLIADPMGYQAELIFNLDYSIISSGNAWLAIFAFTFQIYFDFSGYSDMAIGLGRILGFSFPENFNAPYISQSISEFWRRWHMTLSAFMKDYLYIPLGGNKVSTKRLYINLVTVFFLSGLWHGAAWNYVLWGIYNGIFLIMDRLFLIRLFQKLNSFIRILFTFIIVMMGWIIFRIENLQDLPIYLGKLFSFTNMGIVNYRYDFPLVLSCAALLSFAPMMISGFDNIWIRVDKWSFSHNNSFVVTSGISLLLLVMCVASLMGSGFNPFIYFRF